MSSFSPLPSFGLRPLLGRLVEISGGAASGVLSAALQLVAEAQREERRYGFVAWVASPRSLFFPPDAERSGARPERLALVRVEGRDAQIRAAAHLAHRGAFGLVVVDLADAAPLPINAAPAVASFRSGRPERPADPIVPLSRLAALTNKHGNTVILLTARGRGAPSLDPRIARRYDASRRGGDLRVTALRNHGGDQP